MKNITNMFNILSKLAEECGKRKMNLYSILRQFLAAGGIDALYECAYNLCYKSAISCKEARKLMGGHFFGPEELRKMFDIDIPAQVPPIPWSNWYLNLTCPFDSSKKIYQTHVLIFIPWANFSSNMLLGLIFGKNKTGEFFSMRPGIEKFFFRDFAIPKSGIWYLMPIKPENRYPSVEKMSLYKYHTQPRHSSYEKFSTINYALSLELIKYSLLFLSGEDIGELGDLSYFEDRDRKIYDISFVLSRDKKSFKIETEEFGLKHKGGMAIIRKPELHFHSC